MIGDNLALKTNIVTIIVGLFRQLREMVVIENWALTCFRNKSACAAKAWSAAAIKPMTSSTDHSPTGTPGAGGGGAPVVDDAGSGRSGDTRAIFVPELSPVPFIPLPAVSSCNKTLQSHQDSFA